MQNKLSDNITITPAVIWLTDPNQDDSNGNLVIGALRTTFTHILHQATGSHGYTGKTHLRGFETIDFLLVRVGGLGLYGSAISNR